MKRFLLAALLLFFCGFVTPALAQTFESILPVSATATVNNADALNPLDNNPNEFSRPTDWQAASDPQACITFDLGEVTEGIVGFRESSGPYPGNPFNALVSIDGQYFVEVLSSESLVLAQNSYQEHTFLPKDVRFFKLCIRRTDETGYGELAYFRALVRSKELEQPIAIMPLGDSLTLGFPGDTGGYRASLHDRLQEINCGVDFVGTRGSEPLKHEAATGRTNVDICWNNQLTPSDDNPPCANPLEVSRLPGRSQSPWGSRKQWQTKSPDIIMLLAGTNDYLQRMEAPATYLENLVSAILDDLPNVELFLASVPFIGVESRYLQEDPTHPRPTQCELDRQIKAYNARIRGLANADSEDRLHFVPVNRVLTRNGYYCFDVPFAAFDTVSENDLVHPTENGYEAIANAWFQAIRYLCNHNMVPPSPPSGFRIVTTK